MNSQNTPIHVRLWHRDFWLLSFANLLLTMSVYILIPTFPVWMLETEAFTAPEVGLSLLVFAAGLYALGPFCSWLVQRFRRNRVYLLSVAAMLGSISMLYYLHGVRHEEVELWVILAQRFLMGATFGLAEMVLISTLIIESSESYHRTEANHSTGWFSRFAVALGPIVGLTLFNYQNFDTVLLAAGFCAACAIVLVMIIRIPFRTPTDAPELVSFDRFLLKDSTPLFLNLTLFAAIVGMLMSLGLSDRFYACIMCGFLAALIAQRVVFRDAELKSEIVTGLILLIAALLLVYTRPLPIVWYLAPLMLGLSIGIVCARFLLFFIKLSRHCQRGTSQSTYMLSWETGVSLGLGVGYAFFLNEADTLLLVCLVLAAVALAAYNYYTHNWFLGHKNR